MPNQKQRAWAALELEKLWRSGGHAEREFNSEEMEVLEVEAQTQRREATAEGESARIQEMQARQRPASSPVDEWSAAQPGQQKATASLAGNKALSKLHMVRRLQGKAREKADL